MAAAAATLLGLALLLLPPVVTSASPPGPLKLGISLSVSGPDGWQGVPLLQGIELAIDDVNRGGGPGGHPLQTLLLDSGGSDLDTLARLHLVAAHYERFVADPAVIAVVGPQTSDEGRSVAALLSRANLATITPSSTAFDITDAGLARQFRPGGRAVYFRTVGTDSAQAEAMARFARVRLGVRRVALIDDASQFGERMVEIFARHAAAAGMTVLARSRLNWLQADYRQELRRLAELGPDALYLGVRYDVGVKLARHIPEILPSIRILGSETLHNRAFPIQARATGAEGWYVSGMAPDPSWSPAAAAWVNQFRSRFGAVPSGYSLTAYTAVAVVADAVGRVVKRGLPVTRTSVRDAIQTTRLPNALSGPVSFDPDGDLERPAVSVYQIRGGAFHHLETLLLTKSRGGSQAEARP